MELPAGTIVFAPSGSGPGNGVGGEATAAQPGLRSSAAATALATLPAGNRLTTTTTTHVPRSQAFSAQVVGCSGLSIMYCHF